MTVQRYKAKLVYRVETPTTVLPEVCLVKTISKKLQKSGEGLWRGCVITGSVPERQESNLSK